MWWIVVTNKRFNISLIVITKLVWRGPAMNGARDFVQHVSEITPPETNSKLGSLKMDTWNTTVICFPFGAI